MKSDELIVICITLYKVICLVVGFLSIYLGFILFLRKIKDKAGEISGMVNDYSLKIKNAAPGTFFALFGAIIISFTIYKGMEFERYMSSSVMQHEEPRNDDIVLSDSI